MASVGHLPEALTAYDGVEALAGFTPDGLPAYRAGLLKRTGAQAAFLREWLPADASVAEVCSGNGRLLIDLAAQRAIRYGIGVEISASRTEFAQAWARDAGLEHRLSLVCGDALAVRLPRVDAAFCVTGALAYFDAIRPGGGAALLRRLARAVRPGGTLTVEVYPHAEWRRLLDAAAGGALRLWHELAPDDPWRFYLSTLTLDRDTGLLTHAKTFIHRTTGAVDDTRAERLRLYDGPALEAALTSAGFAAVELFGGWDGAPHHPGDELLIAVAHRGEDG